ncbi:MAG: hypothetical protein IGS03_12570 [Candidatus Sericytochromatia bacterium]|nr:hypothetical protein [Candidatus Sericytochromatia bacterium]
MSLKKTILCTLFLTALFSPAASARPGGPSIKDWDMNRDGKASLLEMQTALRNQFKKADSNTDRFVTAEEILGLMPFFVRDRARDGVKEYIRGQDSNGDGKLTLDEVMAWSKKRFAEIDRNKDSYISKDEFQQAQQQRRGK